MFCGSGKPKPGKTDVFEASKASRLVKPLRKTTRLPTFPENAAADHGAKTPWSLKGALPLGFRVDAGR